MKSTTLHALVIDHHLGELTPETAELLEHHLAHSPDSRAEADRILAALNATQTAIQQHPELAHVSATNPMLPTIAKPASSSPWLRRAAAIAIFGIATTSAFIAGKNSHQPPAETISTARKPSPWARYRLTPAPDGRGMTVVRVDTKEPIVKPIQ